MVESTDMMRCTRRNRVASWLLGALAAASHVPLGAEQRAHVALVDPATTKCTVCHKNVEATHQPEVLGQSCLACHGFAKRDDGTFLVDDGPAKGAVEPSTVPDRPATTKLGGGPPVGGEVGVRSEPPVEPRSHAPAIPPPVVEPSRSTSAPVVAPASGRPPGGEAAVAPPVDLVREQSLARYTTGLDAFRRGDEGAAFAAWDAMLDEAAGQYTIQIAVDRLLESARLALEAHPDHSLYVVPRRGAYYVLAGIFPSRASAAQGLARLPAELTRDGAFPTAVGDLPAER